jgi:hypothetical protein
VIDRSWDSSIDFNTDNDLALIIFGLYVIDYSGGSS